MEPLKKLNTELVCFMKEIIKALETRSCLCFFVFFEEEVLKECELYQRKQHWRLEIFSFLINNKITANFSLSTSITLL